MERFDMVDSAHKMADLLDRYPLLIDYYPNLSASANAASLSIWFYDSEGKPAAAQIAEWIKILRRDVDALPNATEKKFSEWQMTATVKMAGYSVQLAASRDAVCTKIETGEIETFEIPDPDAPKVTRTRPVVKWECSPLLADNEKE